MIEVRGARFGFDSSGAHPVLDLIDLTARDGNITVLTGASGLGKSTLLSLAAGIYPSHGGHLHAGRVTVDGVAPDALAPGARARLVSMMFQNPNLQFVMDTVENEVAFCLENLEVPACDIERKIDAALDFCGIARLKKRLIHTLSGGEKQKAALACMAAIIPKWLLLDEPFANIDGGAARDIIARLVRLRAQTGMGILAVDHRMDRWLDVADEILVMDKGGISFLPKEEWTSGRFESLGIGAPGVRYRAPSPAPKTKNERATLELIKVSSPGANGPIRDACARFYAGRACAMLGESGAGKTTLLNMIAGFEKCAGTVKLDGHAARRGRLPPGTVGMATQCPQDQFLFDKVFAEIRTGSKSDEDALAILRAIGLAPYRNFSPYALSQGQQRQLGVALLLTARCRVLLLDEPSYAQDLMSTRRLMDRLTRYARENAIALIFTTHDEQLARDYADEILELKEGRLYARNESGL